MRRGGRHRAVSYELTKISAWVSKADWEFMQRRHRFAASDVLRRLLSDYRRRCEGYEAPHEAAAFDLEGL